LVSAGPSVAQTGDVHWQPQFSGEELLSGALLLREIDFLSLSLIIMMIE
jgi:hypothetical protein